MSLRCGAYPAAAQRGRGGSAGQRFGEPKPLPLFRERNVIAAAAAAAITVAVTTISASSDLFPRCSSPARYGTASASSAAEPRFCSQHAGLGLLTRVSGMVLVGS